MWASRTGFLNAHIFAFDSLGYPDLYGLGNLLHHCIQRLLMDMVRTEIAFPVPLVARIDIFHAPLAVSAPYYRHKGAAALFAGNQSGF